MSLTVSTSILRTGSIGAGGGAPLLSVKVGWLSPLPLKVGGPKLPLPPLYLRPCSLNASQVGTIITDERDTGQRYIQISRLPRQIGTVDDL